MQDITPKFKQKYDVLLIPDNLELVDIIQTLSGKKCLGTFFNNSEAKLYFCSGIKDEIDIQLGRILMGKSKRWSWEIQPYEDWHLNWQENFKTVTIDAKFKVIPYWKKNVSAEILIKIKPGMAFGTGYHETTHLMLREIKNYISKGMSVLDLGAGSGILSIAAIKFGASHVDAVEYDIDCKINFIENMKLNQINQKVKFYNENVLDWNQFNYDLIVANINRDVIYKLIPQINTSHSIILFSGIINKDYDTINNICINNGMQIKQQISKGGWICLIME